jgi:hypothetical protein
VIVDAPSEKAGQIGSAPIPVRDRPNFGFQFQFGFPLWKVQISLKPKFAGDAGEQITHRGDSDRLQHLLLLFGGRKEITHEFKPSWIEGYLPVDR